MPNYHVLLTPTTKLQVQIQETVYMSLNLLLFDLEQNFYLALKKKKKFEVIKQTSEDSKNTANAVYVP